MANIAGHYDQNAEPSEFDRIPAGTYRAKIAESEIADISEKSDKGRCLKLTWHFETGPYDGRLFWQRLNMWPKNMDNIDKVVTIANQQFAAIRQATGKLAPQDSTELHHIPCLITIGPQKNDANYDEVKSVKPIAVTTSAPQQQRSASPPSSSPSKTAPQTTAANTTGGSAPWRKTG